VIAAAGVGGVTGLLSGAIGAGVQARSAVRQVAVQLDVLGRQQADEHRRRRLDAYLEFLDAERSFQLMHQTNERIDPETYRRWQTDFDHAYHAVKLLGTPEVLEAIIRFSEVFPSRLKMWSSEGMSKDTYSNKIHASYAELLPLIRRVRPDVYSAMQADVGPTAAPW
jgi:hypothetical protein